MTGKGLLGVRELRFKEVYDSESKFMVEKENRTVTEEVRVENVVKVILQGIGVSPTHLVGKI